MPNSKSAAKRLRQSQDRRVRNRSAKSSLRGQLRKVRELAASGDKEAGMTEFKLLTKKLDRAAAGKVIHRNAAARLKSRTSKRLKAAGQKAAAGA